jgi:hypothetical protein
LAGTYAVYRWSHSLRGKYILRGTISIIPGPDGTVDTEEHYSTAEAEDQKEATQFYRSGFFIYRENASLMFSRKSGIRDVQTVHVKKIEFSSTRGGDGKLSWMLGWIVDWENVDLYVTQIAILNIGELPSGFVRAVLPTKEFVEDRALAWLTQASRDDFPNILRF